MENHEVPLGFGFVLNQNTAAMNRYAQLSQAQKQNLIEQARHVHSEREMYNLVAGLANGNI